MKCDKRTVRFNTRSSKESRLKAMRAVQNKQKRVKCISCGKDIHISEFGGISKEGMVHDNLVCIMKFTEKRKEINETQLK